jgi:hypothetical protein
MNTQQSREYIRHPSQVPLEVLPHRAREQLNLQLNNVSLGGLSFTSPVEFHTNTIVRIKIPTVKPVFKVNGLVQWCKKTQGHFEMGVQFLDEDDAFKVRMVEQVCHISEYRKHSQRQTGKCISWNKASLEWIEKNGGSFPR